MTRAGATLLEAVVSIAILSVAMVSLMGILAQHVDGRRRAEGRVRAAYLAEQRLEIIRALDAEELRRMIGEESDGAFASPFDSFRWRATVRSADDARGLVEVDVLVEWEGGRFPISTLMYRPPRPVALTP